MNLEQLDNEWKALKMNEWEWGSPEFNMGFAWHGARYNGEFPDQIKVLEYILSQGKKLVSVRSKQSKEKVVSETWEVLNASIEKVDTPKKATQEAKEREKHLRECPPCRHEKQREFEPETKKATLSSEEGWILFYVCERHKNIGEFDDYHNSATQSCSISCEPYPHSTKTIQVNKLRFPSEFRQKLKEQVQARQKTWQDVITVHGDSFETKEAKDRLDEDNELLAIIEASELK